MPKRAFTDAAVKRLKLPKAGQQDVFDQGYPGLALRLSYGANRSWVYFYRINGRLRRMTLGIYPALSLADAREAWRNARNDVHAGREPTRPRGTTDADSTFEKALENWLKRDQANNRTKEAVKRLIDKDATPAWRHRHIADIGRADVLDVIDKVVDRGSPITARRLHAHLHRFFTWHTGRGKIPFNPMAHLPKPGAETQRERVLNDKELEAVWRAAKEIGWPFGDAVRLLILTGARREEIGGLKWNEIDDDTVNLAGERTKNGEPHTIPLSSAAAIVLQEVPRIANSERVFTTNGKTSVSGWSRAKRNLDELSKVKEWRIHDLRRTVATGLQKLGVNLQTIEAVLGHTSGSRSGVVGVYQRHSFDAEKRAALDAWGARVIELVDALSMPRAL
jgi:integrase